MNTRASGRKREIQCRNLLIEQGWNTHLADMPHKWKLQQDIFGVCDILGIRKVNGKAEKIYVQVKSGSTQGCKKKLKEFKEQWLDDKDKVQVWIWIKRHGFRIVEV